jgi:mRNA interferase HigB
MRIISERRLREFWEAARGNERTVRERAMRDSIHVVRRADWNTFMDVRRTFNHVDTYGTCTVFDVGGNKYRIIAKLAYRKKAVFIRFVLTHEDYDESRWKSDCK